MSTVSSTVRFANELSEIFSDNKFVVFLCGPMLEGNAAPGAVVRGQIKELLESDGFEVVLGEDEGLEEPRLNLGAYAHSNELLFVKKYSNAVVLVADSVGSFCELGLFSYIKTLSDGGFPDFILIVNKEFEGQTSYFSEGPAKAVKHHGVVMYEDFANFNPSEMLERLRGRRATYFMDMRGRPPGGSNS